jgi:hypothetical protein
VNNQLWFTTSKFEPIAGEDKETNPGRFGKALAIWVRQKLLARGKPITEEIIPEDWGWVVMVQRKPFPLWIGCGNEDGSKTRWSLLVTAEPNIFQKILKRVDTAPAVSALETELEQIVRAEPGLEDIEWEKL